MHSNSGKHNGDTKQAGFSTKPAEERHVKLADSVVPERPSGNNMASPKGSINQENPSQKFESQTLDGRALSGSGTFSSKWDEEDDRYNNEIKSLISQIKYKPPTVSVYKVDYLKHPLDKRPPKMDNNPWATFRVEQPIDFNTTNRLDYKPNNQGPPPRNHLDLWKARENKIPFGGRSSYKAEYINWGQNPSAIEKPVAPKTVISELPFVGKSLYAEDFSEPKNVTRVYKIDHNLFGKKSPLSPNVPLLAETTTGRTYGPFKVHSNVNVKKKAEAEPNPAWPGQWNTTYGGDYRNQPQMFRRTQGFKPKYTLL